MQTLTANPNRSEPLLDQNDISLSERTHLMMYLRINRQGTRIVDQHGFVDHYESSWTSEQFVQFNQGTINLDTALFHDGALDQSTKPFNLECFIEHDQTLYRDKWLRDLSPLSEFHADSEKNYQNTTRPLNNFQKTKVNGFRTNL